MSPLLSMLKYQLAGRKWGYVIFRCTYGDDASWERFITDQQTKAEDTYEQLDWTVQEDMSLGARIRKL
jgi:hypothetical protein